MMRLLAFLALAVSLGAEPVREILDWRELPSIPDTEGFAGSYAGVSGGALLVAGGANFPDRRPWAGGTKTWYDAVFVLDRPDGTWRAAGKLPRVAGYGVSLSIAEGVLLVGGGDAGGNFRDVRIMRWDGSSVAFRDLPPLPVPLAMAAGAVIAHTVYVAGGLERPDSPVASRRFLALDLDRPADGWRDLEPWPGPERFLATAGTLDGSLCLFGGARLEPGPDGRPRREWLRDAWRYTPGQGWKRLADLPTPLVATPGPAPALGPAHLLLLGGDDGSLVDRTPADHPGFPRKVWAYHTITDTWAELGTLPFSLVTSNAVTWQGRIVVPGGEARPGVRSTATWAATPRIAPSRFGTGNYLALAAYPIVMLGISWWVGRKQSSDEFFRGGQRLPWWAAGLSIYATMLSSITFMAVPAKAYATDWTFFLANVPVLLLAPVVIAFYLPFYRRLNLTSAYEYLERRFNLAVRWVGSASFILLHLGRTAIVLYLPALALATVSSFDMRLCILIMGAICLVMTYGGGIETVVWTDVAQTIILLLAAFATLLVALAAIPGGASAALAVLDADHKGLSPLRWDASVTVATGWVILIGNVFANLVSYTAGQDVVQRYVSTPHARDAARSIWTNALLVLPSTALFFAVGGALYVFYKSHPTHLEPRLATDAIYPLFIVNELPAGVGGLVVAGIFAAAQPTSSLNSIATAWVTDFHARLRPALDDAGRLRSARAATVFSGLVGTLIALLMTTVNIASIWDAFLGMIGLTGGVLAGLFSLGIFSRRAHGAGAATGALVGLAVVVAVKAATSVHFFLYAATGFLACFVAGWVASVLLPSPSKDNAGLTWRS